MKKDSTTAADLPSEVSEVDALAMENLHLKADKAQVAFNLALDAFRAKAGEVSKTYKLNLERDVIDYATRKIERR